MEICEAFVWFLFVKT